MTLISDRVKIFELFNLQAFHEASTTKSKPTAVIAKTYKGRNFPTIEDEENWHGKPLGDKSEEVIQVSLPQILTICAGNTIAQDGVNAM
jgi:transketolase